MVNIGHGIIPHHPVAPTLDNWIERNDVEMEFAMQLIRTIAMTSSQREYLSIGIGFLMRIP